MAIKVKLIRSVSGKPQDQKDTIIGLGLNKISSERLLRDTPPIRGMVKKVAHLLEVTEVPGDAPTRKRTKGFPNHLPSKKKKEA